MKNEEIIKNKLKPIFDCLDNQTNIVTGVIELSNGNDFDELQEGYRYNKSGEITDWIGDNYYIIGLDSTMGDPYITDINKEELPIYTMYHDDWKSLRQISKDFNTFAKILKALNECHLNLKSSNEDSLNALKIISDIENEYIDYWQELLMIEN